MIVTAGLDRLTLVHADLLPARQRQETDLESVKLASRNGFLGEPERTKLVADKLGSQARITRVWFVHQNENPVDRMSQQERAHVCLVIVRRELGWNVERQPNVGGVGA
jgi:hypothetical protein